MSVKFDVCQEDNDLLTENSLKQKVATEKKNSTEKFVVVLMRFRNSFSYSFALK